MSKKYPWKEWNPEPLAAEVISREESFGAGLADGEPLRIDLNFSFARGSLSGLDLVQLYESGLGFEPRYITSSFAREEPFFEARHLSKIKAQKRASVDLAGDATGGALLISEHPPPFDHQALEWSRPSGRWDDLSSAHWLARKPGFRFGFQAHGEDLKLQSMPYSNPFHLARRAFKHLPHEPDPHIPFEYRIDISRNPGRHSSVRGMLLACAWRMWMGAEVLARLDRDAIMRFEGTRRIEEIGEDLIFIELYEDPLSAAEPENRAIQEAFRRESGIDALESSLKL